MKQWIEHHKRILQKAASALLAFVVGASLVFMIHPVKILPKDRLLSLSQMKENSQRFVASSSKELGDFICIRQKIWKSSEFYTRRYEFWSASPARLRNSCERNLSL